jgi:cytochrome P450 family 628
MYEERVLQVSQTLVKQVTARSGQVIEARDWFLWFSFDCMGAVAFGKSFGTVDRGESHFALEILKGGTDIFGIFGYIPWAFPLLTSLPGNPFNRFIDWCAGQVEERKRVRIR